jgi:hypothetical protein
MPHPEPNGKLRIRESIMDRVREFDKHLKEEMHIPGGVHPDGCFFCGGRHSSIACEKEEEWHRQIKNGRPVRAPASQES